MNVLAEALCERLQCRVHPAADEVQAVDLMTRVDTANFLQVEGALHCLYNQALLLNMSRLGAMQINCIVGLDARINQCRLKWQLEM